MAQTISVLLEQAISSSTEEDAKRIRERCARLRASLDAYEETALRYAQRQVVERMLGAVGLPIPDEHALVDGAQVKVAEKALHEAMEGVSALIRPPSLASVQDPVPPSEPTPPISSSQPIVTAVRATMPSPPESRPRRVEVTPPVIKQVRPDDLEAGRRVLKEVEEVANTDLSQQHKIRLSYHLQALVAEIRVLLNKIPEHHSMHRDLVTSFQTIANLKEDAGITTFINGMKRGSTGNWERLATISRNQLAKFDLDAQEEPVQKPAAKPKKKEEVAPEAEPEKDERFPKLAAMTKANGPIILVGGMKIPERLDYLKRLGIEAEWHEIPKDSPRTVDQIVARIQNRKMPAILVLEQFMAHTVYTHLQNACNASKVPFAKIGKGGKGQLDLALMSMEGRAA